MFPDLAYSFCDHRAHQQWFAFTSLSEADNRVWGCFQVRNGVFNDLSSSWLESQAVMRGTDRFFFRLERDATHAIGITGRRCRDRAFPAPQEEITCSRTMIGQCTSLAQVLYQAVM